MDEPTELIQAGDKWQMARTAERQAREKVYELIQAEHANGVPETQLAKFAGVDRMTVRRALGKL